VSTTFQPKSDRHLLEVESSGAAVEAVGGLGVIVLSILGLINLVPATLAAIAAIVFGVAALAQGSAIATEHSQLFSKFGGDTTGSLELGGGMTAEIMAGGAAIVLGVLALLRIAPEVLLPASVIVGGASLMLTAGSVRRLNNMKMAAAEASSTDSAQRVLHAATSGAAGSQLLAGVGAIVLGIIALASQPATTLAAAAPQSWLTLTLVGLLVLGASIMISGGSLTGRLMQMFSRSSPQS
jgi:hypothetical protein